MKNTNLPLTTETYKQLLAAVLDDCHGVSQETYNIFCNIASTNVDFADALGELSEYICCSQGRVFLPEDWNE